MTPQAPAVKPASSRTAVVALCLALSIIPMNVGILVKGLNVPKNEVDMWLLLFTLLAFIQLLIGLVALIAGIVHRVRFGAGGVLPAVFGGLASLGAIAGGIGGF